MYSNTVPSILLDSNKTARNQKKEGRSKRQISIKLNASRMKKNGPTLPTSDTLKIRLQQLRNPRCACVPTVDVGIQNG